MHEYMTAARDVKTASAAYDLRKLTMTYANRIARDLPRGCEIIRNADSITMRWPGEFYDAECVANAAGVEVDMVDRIVLNGFAYVQLTIPNAIVGSK